MTVCNSPMVIKRRKIMWSKAVIFLLQLGGCSAFVVVQQDIGTTRTALPFSSASDFAKQLLYQDQQQAMLRRSLDEHELLKGRTKELLAPKITTKTERGTGFGGIVQDKKTLIAAQQSKIIHQDGVLRIDQALEPALADRLKTYVLEQQALALEATEADPSLARLFYGVEQARAFRCDLQLSLLRGGYARDRQSDPVPDGGHAHVLADALQALLGKNGTLRAIYDNLVTMDGELYELAAVVTDPGSNRQIIHPDLPFKEPAPLYVIFLALQDVDEAMGPTSFLLRTHTAKENAKFNDHNQKDAQLASVDCRLSTLKKGDAILFDARILHCGNANDPVLGKTRALFNFSFRNPSVTGNLGYDGSIRPAYCQAMTLRDVSDALVVYENGDPDPFSKFGSGI